MSTFERTLQLLKKGLVTSWAYLFGLAFAAVFIQPPSLLRGADGIARVVVTLLFGAWSAVFGLHLYRRATGRDDRSPSSREWSDLKLGFLIVVGIYALLQTAGGITDLLYPAFFLAVALLVIHTERWVGLSLLALAVAIEFAIAAFGPAGRTFYPAAVHSLFLLLFSLLPMLSGRAGVARNRHRSERRLAETRINMARDAQAFRLIGPAPKSPALGSRDEDPSGLAGSSMDRLNNAIEQHIHLLKRTMRLHTCALLWLDAQGTNMVVKKQLSDSGQVTAKPIRKGDGVLGTVMKHRKTLRLEGISPGSGGLLYYAGPVNVTDFIGIPFWERDHLLGVLCADRIDGRPFSKEDVAAMEASVGALQSIIVNERVYHQLQKAKSEQGKLLMASEDLSRNPEEGDLLKAALVSVGRIVPFEIGAVALLSDEGDQVVREAAGPGSSALIGVVVSAAESLAAAALKNRHYLPYRGKLIPRQQILLSRESQPLFLKMHSALVLPLTSGETSIGTLLLASPEEEVFNEEVRTTLQVMTNQLGPVIENARMYQKLRELATTDGLTGLPNHRIFQDSLDTKLASSARLGTNLSVIFCDVDHFKRVNDTFGHPFGDLVLKKLASILKREVVRDTDLPARYGGEEFAIICEGTDTKGAVLLAERIRKELEKELFQTGRGTLQVTISIGIATYPLHARQKEALLECADIALYAAKEGGRNQVRIWEKGLQKKGS